jgi:hypothetical protein
MLVTKRVKLATRTEGPPAALNEYVEAMFSKETAGHAIKASPAI